MPVHVALQLLANLPGPMYLLYIPGSFFMAGKST